MESYLHHRRTPPPFFWGDRTGHQIDLLIEESITLYPAEIKASQTLSLDMTDGLLWWTRLAGLSPHTATLVHGGAEDCSLKDVAIDPWFAV